MITEDKIVMVVVLICMHLFNYAVFDDQIDEEKLHSMIAKTSLEKELINTGRYALFKMVHKLYNMLEPNAYFNRRLIPEFKKNAGLELYIVFDDCYITNPTDICMPWGRIYLSQRYSGEQKQKIVSLLRQCLKVRHISFFENFACYQVLQIEDNPLPNQIERGIEKGRTIKDINDEWNILSYMYNQEQSIV